MVPNRLLVHQNQHLQNQGLMNQLKELKPYAVVMDLARSYHKFVTNTGKSQISETK